MGWRSPVGRRRWPPPREERVPARSPPRPATTAHPATARGKPNHERYDAWGRVWSGARPRRAPALTAVRIPFVESARPDPRMAPRRAGGRAGPGRTGWLRTRATVPGPSPRPRVADDQWADGKPFVRTSD